MRGQVQVKCCCKGSDEVKAEDLRILIMYLLLYGLIFRRWEDNQDDISEISD